jgi:hypothetical protein
MDCHVPGQLAAGKPWVFAGTLYTNAAGAAPIAKAEIRVVGPDNALIGSAYTDQSGNFWLDKPGTTIPAGSKVGVRKEGGGPVSMAMTLQPTNNGCNSTAGCHGAGTPGKIYAP